MESGIVRSRPHDYGNETTTHDCRHLFVSIALGRRLGFAFTTTDIDPPSRATLDVCSTLQAAGTAPAVTLPPTEQPPTTRRPARPTGSPGSAPADGECRGHAMRDDGQAILVRIECRLRRRSTEKRRKPTPTVTGSLDRSKRDHQRQDPSVSKGLPAR
ncbi:hypothetical protein LX36DRAFT_701260 [Colletotrichum falcatum]|nr:hypothetical protein LX36DRAFT_701260 [Colletotrichum falcatum]